MGRCQNVLIEQKINWVAKTIPIGKEFTQYEFAIRLDKEFPKLQYTWLQLSGLMRGCRYLDQVGKEAPSQSLGTKSKKVMVYKRNKVMA